MEKSRVRVFMKFLCCVTLILSLYACNNKRLSQKGYNQILDSLKQIKVPLVFDSIEYFNRENNDYVPESIDSDSLIIFEYRDIGHYFHKEVRHRDSLFEDVYEYYPNGRLNLYYRRYFNSSGLDPVGYVVFYNEQGEVESFCNGLYSGQKTGNKAKYTIYDVINKIQNDSIDLFKHDVYIAYTDWTGKKNAEYRNKEHYWIVIINYYHDHNVKDKKIKYQRKLRISPDTGEVLEEWIDQWE